MTVFREKLLPFCRFTLKTIVFLFSITLFQLAVWQLWTETDVFLFGFTGTEALGHADGHINPNDGHPEEEVGPSKVPLKRITVLLSGRLDVVAM